MQSNGNNVTDDNKGPLSPPVTTTCLCSPHQPHMVTRQHRADTPAALPWISQQRWEEENYYIFWGKHNPLLRPANRSQIPAQHFSLN